MHKQDFVHVRALIVEICEKDQTIRNLNEIVSAARMQVDDLERQLERALATQDRESYTQTQCRMNLSRRVEDLIAENNDLRQKRDKLLWGPKPSDEEVVALIREQLPEFNKNSSAPKISAIKAARELQRCGLKEAKDLIEAMPEFKNNPIF